MTLSNIKIMSKSILGSGSILSDLNEIKRLAAENEKLAETQTDFGGSGFFGKKCGEVE
jgi:hypothetical protein